MYSKIFSAAAVALAASQLVAAQTSTDCDPRQKANCPTKVNPALGKTEVIDFTKGPNTDFFEIAAGTKIDSYDPVKGAVFKIENEKNAPTFTAKKYIFFGTVSVILQAAPGTGVVTSVVLQSADLDEIDWEWLGGDKAQVQTNYFGKGDTTTYDRGAYHAVANPQDQFYNYTIDWTPDYVKWYIEGNLVRTLNYNDAKGGSTFPQTPCQLKIGTWVAGGKDSPKGTVEWAGGYTDFSQGPFNGYYKSITISDYHKGASKYEFPDQVPNDGSWKSIKVTNGGSSDDISSSASAASKTTSMASATGSASASATDVSKTNSTMMTTTTSARGLTQATDGSDIVSSSANSTIRATMTPTMTPTPSSTGAAASSSAPGKNAGSKQGLEWTNGIFAAAGLLAYLAL